MTEDGVLRQAVDRLLSEQLDADEQTFLGAQFDAGLAWVHFPKGFGGLDLMPEKQLYVNSRLTEAGRLGPLTRNQVGIGMAAPTLAVHGTPHQRQRFGRRIFTAEDIWCQLFSEPGAGSDLAGLSTRALRDGDVWVVEGQKVWSSFARVAQWGLLLARTDPDVPKHQGLTCFAIDMTQPGIDARPLVQMTGEATFCEVFITDAQVPDCQRIGPVGAGWNVAITTLMNERFTMAVAGVNEPRGGGYISEALAAWERVGQPNPVRRDELMRLWIDAEVLRLAKTRVQVAQSQGTPSADGSLLKLGSTQLVRRIGAFLVDVLGPDALTYVYQEPTRLSPAGRFLWSQSQTIGGGTSDVQRNIIAERLLGLPREPAVDRALPWSQVPRS